MVIIVMVFGHLKRLLSDRYNDESYLLFGVATLLLVRSFVEIDMLNPYQIGSFLLYFSAGKLMLVRRTQARPTLRLRKQVEYAA